MAQDPKPKTQDPLSEFDLIEIIRNRSSIRDSSIIRSIGDDCAVIRPSSSEKYVISTDLLIEGTHFRREWISPEFLGRKSLLVNLSDLAAMGAKPHSCLLGLSFPGQLKGSYFNRMISGFLRECDKNGVSLIGGDLAAGTSISISVTAIGTVDSGEPVYRSDAKPGDQIFLIGTPGLSRAGLEFLLDSSVVGLDMASSETELERLVGEGPEFLWLKAHLLPDIKLEPGRWLRHRGVVNSLIDISDGLGSDLGHILEASLVSGAIDLELLPEIPGITERSECVRLSLDGGEDYCLVGTCSAEQATVIHEDYPAGFPPVTFIGQIDTGKPVLHLVSGNKKVVYQKKGYDHFN